MNLKESIEGVLCSNLSDRDKIDKLFEIDCIKYTKLGSDSTKTERRRN
jgi:hypothetical protein